MILLILGFLSLVFLWKEASKYEARKNELTANELEQFEKDLKDVDLETFK